MTQNVTQQATVPLGAFNQASLDGASDRLQELKLDEGRSTMVAFINNIPGMPDPPFVYCKVHWNSEMGDKGRMYQCFGGSCCQQVTWQKGWGGEPGKFEVHKARTRYFIPLVHYEQDQNNPTAIKATIKYLNITYTAYNIIASMLKNLGEDVFFSRDVKLEAQKVNGALLYQVYPGSELSQWKSNPVFKQQVDEQLPLVAERLLSAMPKLYTESEFMQMKPELDRKLQLAMSSYTQQTDQSQAQVGATPMQGGFSPIPQQPAYTQPQVNLPIQPSVDAIASQSVQQTVVDNIASQPVQQTAIDASIQNQAVQPQTVETATQPQKFEIPKVALDFDPNTLLK